MPVFGFIFTWGLLELIVLILIASSIGALWTIILLLLSSSAGVILLRKVQRRFIRATQQSQGIISHPNMKHGMFQFMGALLLFVPGFISTMLALICLLPVLRQLFGGIVLRLFNPEAILNGARWQRYRDGHVYEGSIDATPKTNPTDHVQRGEWLPPR